MPECKKFVVGGVEEASHVCTLTPLFVAFSEVTVNQW